ncbi:MAG: hypothetical protein Q8L60_09695 [Gammaproteobacteria bacterium]|nr:hypothetical protein [Gammaproteobacteria bacterium]MDP2139705.1 hypothetical protein [Gammaproteobacteria bacterium]
MPGNHNSELSSLVPALSTNQRLIFDTASKIPVRVVIASTKVTQLTTNGTENRVHNVVPSFIIIKWAGAQRATYIVGAEEFVEIFSSKDRILLSK